MKKRSPKAKVAIIHDWLTGMRGGEKVLDVFCELFPDADLFTLVHIEGTVSPKIETMKVHTSFLQNLPGIETLYRHCLPLMPWAITQFDLSDYDFVLSSSHCVAKGVRTPQEASHVCYCHTPMRYIWDQFDDYFGPGRCSPVVRLLMRALRPKLQAWDKRTAENVAHFIANSENVRARIKKHYGREAAVIYPPIDTSFFVTNGRSRSDFFLMVTAFAPYKNVDMAVETFNRLHLPLVIAGHGQELKKISLRAGPSIKFLGWVPNDTLKSLYQEARAVIFPGEEDFGMVPLEAQASGCPVIALAKGGALESVLPSQTGLLFSEPTPEALADCVQRFHPENFDPLRIRQNALRFDAVTFRKKFVDHILGIFPDLDSVLKEAGKSP